jgi:hypothetical protein
VDTLPSKKLFSGSQIDDQKLRQAVIPACTKMHFQVQEYRDSCGDSGGDHQGSAGQLELLHGDQGGRGICALSALHCTALHAGGISPLLQDEAERLAETTRATFSLEPLPESFTLDENDFVHGLPKVSPRAS